MDLIEDIKKAEGIERKIELSVSYLNEIKQSVVYKGYLSDTDFIEFDGEGSLSSQLNMDYMISILEIFSKLLCDSKGINLKGQIHEVLKYKFSKSYEKPNVINNAEIAELIAFILVKAESLNYKVNVKEEFLEYISIIKEVKNKPTKRSNVGIDIDDDYDEYDFATKQYNECMAWQDGEIDDDEYFNSRYSY